MKARLIFDTDKCKGCSLCVKACPVKILAIDTTRMNAIGYNPSYCIDMDKCIACASCAMMCPDTVITVMKVEA